MSTVIRAVILFFVGLIGSAIIFIGGTGGMIHAMGAGNVGSARPTSVLADSLGISNMGFTWGEHTHI